MTNIFHARWVILMTSVYSLVITREYDKGIRDAQSRNENEFTLCCQIINSLESVGMEGTCRGLDTEDVLAEGLSRGAIATRLA